MATKIETLKKPNGDQVLPRTRAKAVSMENGTTVEAAISDIKTLIGEAKVADQIANAVENATKDLATEKYVDAKVSNLVNSAPEALDTLNELAAALGNDVNFAATVTNSLAGKVDKVSGKGLSTNDFTDEYKAKVEAASQKSQVQIITWEADD